MQVLPLTADPCRFFTTDLGDGKYTIETKWNERAGWWTLDITRDSDQVTLVAGVPILIGQDMLAPYALQIGGLIAADLNATSVSAASPGPLVLDAGPEDLGERVIVTYLTQAELAVLHDIGIPGIAVRSGDPGTPEFEDGGPATGGSAHPLVDMTEHEKTDDVEAIVMQFEIDLTAHLFPTVAIAAAFMAISEGGNSYVRAYYGGTSWVIDGDLISAMTVVEGDEAPFSFALPALTNPHAVTYLKLSMQTAAPTGVVGKMHSFSGTLT